jgi:putative transposase
VTPAAVHLGQAPALFLGRQHVLTAAYATHPERFVRGVPQPPALPTEVWINRPAPAEKEGCDTAERH